MTQEDGNAESRPTKILGRIENAASDQEVFPLIVSAQENETRRVAHRVIERGTGIDLSAIGSAELELTGIFWITHHALIDVIAEANSCETVRWIERRNRPRTYSVEIRGEMDDVEWVRALSTSTKTYLDRSVREWVREHDNYAELTPWQKFLERKSYRLDFVSHVKSGLLRARRNAEHDVAAATQPVAGRRDVSTIVGQINAALAERDKHIASRLRDKFGDRRTRSRRSS
jgi:hypothetical protein